MSENMSMDSLLDSNLDDFADLPEFVTPPSGTYTTKVNFSTKVVNDKPGIEVKLTILAVNELNNPEDTPPADGSVASQFFFMDNEFGQGAFKKCTANLKAATGSVTIRDIITNCDGMECVTVTSTRKDKNDKEKLYLNIKDMFPV